MAADGGFRWETCPVCRAWLPVYFLDGYLVSCFQCKGPRYGRVSVVDDKAETEEGSDEEEGEDLDESEDN